MTGLGAPSDGPDPAVLDDVPSAPPLLRPARPSDVERLAALERELFPGDPWSAPMIAAELDGPGRWYVVAEAGEPAGVVGWAGLWFDGEDAQIMTVGVTARSQGQGLGRALTARVLDQARELGARRVLLEVRVDNDVAVGLYERMGFTRMGLRRGYYRPEGADALTMELVLR